MPSRPLRIGTRGSPMALYQAELVRDRLRAAHPELAAEGALELVPIRTTGDRVQTRLLAEIGGKGLFTKEIEEALLDRRIDLAVHSLKDMETVLPAGLAIGVRAQARRPARRAGRPRGACTLAGLPRGARVGTASLRRRAQLLRMRPDLAIVPIRGNVNTRLAKLDAGEVEALVLALCGLERLGKQGAIGEILDVDVMLPAVAQGALAIECRALDEAVRASARAVARRAERGLRAGRAEHAGGARRLLPHADRRIGDDRRRSAQPRRAAAVAGRQRPSGAALSPVRWPTPRRSAPRSASNCAATPGRNSASAEAQTRGEFCRAAPG